jgi:hypothetical protein
MLYAQTTSSVLDMKSGLHTKFIHPKVIQVLTKLREPSPIRVPRDDTQPRSGDLKNMKTKTEVLITIRNTCEKTKNVSLCLGSNSLLLKRRIDTNTGKLE